MAESTPSRIRDQIIPKRNGEEMRCGEPRGPQPGPEREERRPPMAEREKGRYENDRNEK
jgi:hypothetical protein